MDIVFVKIPRYLVFICILLRKIGFKVFYLELSGYVKDEEKIMAEKLKKLHICPLPLESIQHIDDFSECYSDPEMTVFNLTQSFTSREFLQGFERLYPDNTNVTRKLQIIVHAVMAKQMLNVTRRINIWANANQDRNHLLIDLSLSGFVIPKLASNVCLLIIPLDLIERSINLLVGYFHRIINLCSSSSQFKKKVGCIDESRLKESDISRVVYVTHKGLSYGNLFQKNLFHSDQVNSELYTEKLLHFDYSGFPSPSPKIKWVNIGNHRQSIGLNIYNAMVALGAGIFKVRRFRHIIGLMILIRSYVVFKSYLRNIQAFNNLKIALIDYEILCPKELLLAFEAKGILTVSVQERFITSFKHNLIGSTILSNYLSASQFASDAMKSSPINCIDHYVPVGQYRSDHLFHAKSLSPPKLLEVPIAKGYKIITALGFHTIMDWYGSQVDPMLNWTAHKHFLEDMIRLTEDIPDVFIVLRYKFIDWTELPIFAQILKKIQSSERMAISTEYEKSFFSYDLCAHSDLVIAKPTSIADECLSVGIPVLFHEYLHNAERIISDAFDYGPARIMCYKYEQLLERVLIVLGGSPNEMSEDYEYLRNVVYGGLGDGRVIERVHAYLEELLDSGTKTSQ